MRLQLTSPPTLMPDAAVPSEVTVEDVASTSLPGDGDDCFPIFHPSPLNNVFRDEICKSSGF